MKAEHISRERLNEVAINGWKYSHTTPRKLAVYRHVSGHIAREVKPGGKVKVFDPQRQYVGWSPDIAAEVKRWVIVPIPEE